MTQELRDSSRKLMIRELLLEDKYASGAASVKSSATKSETIVGVFKVNGSE
jgi:hypothetical protein